MVLSRWRWGQQKRCFKNTIKLCFLIIAPTIAFEATIKESGPNTFMFDDISAADNKRKEVELERTERYVLERCPKDFGSTSKYLRYCGCRPDYLVFRMASLVHYLLTVPNT